MPKDPVEEWRRLSALYAEMGDLEIRELARQINDLTETAQQILRDELKKRGISEKPALVADDSDDDFAGLHSDESDDSDQDIDPDAMDSASPAYTWKTGLCRCESIDEAAQRTEMLRRAGIESWVQRPGSLVVAPWLETGVGDIQLNVADDQLELARVIGLGPIPQDIINEWEELQSAPAYEIPRCPRCKAEDPTLESVEPANRWLCEACGHTWYDPDPASAN